MELATLTRTFCLSISAGNTAMHHVQRASSLIDSLGSQVQKITIQCARGLKRSSQISQKAEAAKAPPRGIPYKDITIGVPKETFLGEKRVALAPAATAILIKKGFNVNIQENAGLDSKITNDDYAAAGAKIVSSDKAFKSDLVLKVRQPSPEEVKLFNDRGTLFSYLYPAQNMDLVELMQGKKMTVFAMDQVPRISRAQSFDVLSSMANIAGYKAVVEAASNFERFFTGRL
jgi:NAD(P) transhydrogenase